MENIKVGSKVQYTDGYGTQTLCKVIEIEANGVYARVKWLEPRWNLQTDSLVQRKGTVSLVGVSSLSSFSK